MADGSSTAGSPHVTVTVHVDAPAQDVYRLVADLTRMGEWSPECTRVVWRGGAGSAAVGARFRGWNRHGPVRWCTVTEEWTDRRSKPYAAVTGLAVNVRDRPTHNRLGMERTLASLKAAAEAAER